MSNDNLLIHIGKALQDANRPENSTAAERELEGSLDSAFENRLFEQLGVAEAQQETPRNLIPFPPNRARASSTTRIAAVTGLFFAAAAAFFLVQRGPTSPLGTYEMSAQSDQLERGTAAPEGDSSEVTATVGRPFTLILRPTIQTSATPDVHVFATLDGQRVTWSAQIEQAQTGAIRVVTTPSSLGRGQLTVVLVPHGQSFTEQPRVELTRAIAVRALP